MIHLLWLVPTVAALGVVVNRLTWSRPAAGGVLPGRLSILIPARDEAANIVGAVEAALASDAPVAELIVYDDGSTDTTPDLLRGLRRTHPTLRVITGGRLPAGWVGKPHACHRLAEVATGEVLLFLDADVRLTADGLSRLARALETPRADGRRPDLVTAVPTQQTGTLAEALLLPLLHLTYTAWLPLALVRLVPFPSVLAANGQVLLVRRAAYDRIGGFAAVRTEVVDDMAFCRRIKVTGGIVDFVDGAEIASCRMYRSATEVATGFSKNIYEGVGGHPLGVLAGIGLYLAAFVAPYVALEGAAVGRFPPATLLPAAAGVAANLVARGVLALRHGHGWRSVLLHPVAVLGLTAIAIRSAWWSHRGAIRWRGRRYEARAQRGSA